MAQTKIEEINEYMLDRFEEFSIEDTIANRVGFLQTIREGLQKEKAPTDINLRIEKAFYQIALTAEIRILMLKLELSQLVK